MSRFYRLSITEINLLEVIVELRDSFVEKYPAEFINNTLGQAATDAIRQRWKMIHPNTDYPPICRSIFKSSRFRILIETPLVLASVLFISMPPSVPLRI
jgi:hypothetical protein